MISIRQVSKTYGGKTRAVDNLSLEILPGEIFGFLGPNGAGKTTLLKMMTGITSIDSGDIILDQKSITDEALAAKQELGFVPDNPNIFLRLKGLEYLNFMADVYGVESGDRVARIERLSREFSLDTVLNDRIQTYSHGMRQKIVLIGALIHDPKIWLLDEPMTGLDPRASFQLKQRMRSHADQGYTVLFATHVLDVAEKVCDRLAIIDKGKLLFCGTIPELRESYSQDSSLEAMFLELVAADEMHDSPFRDEDVDLEA